MILIKPLCLTFCLWLMVNQKITPTKVYHGHDFDWAPFYNRTKNTHYYSSTASLYLL